MIFRTNLDPNTKTDEQLETDNAEVIQLDIDDTAEQLPSQPIVLDPLNDDEIFAHLSRAVYTQLGVKPPMLPCDRIEYFKHKGDELWFWFSQTSLYALFGSIAKKTVNQWSFDGTAPLHVHDLKEIAQLVRQRPNNNAEAAIGRIFAKRIFESATEANHDHPYLLNKKVPVFNARQSGDVIYIPLIDQFGEVKDLQLFFTNGAEWLFVGGNVKGLFSLLGPLPKSGRLYICEDWPTAATLHIEKGVSVAAAMNHDNLRAVCILLRELLPDEVEIVVAIDNDLSRFGCPSYSKGVEAAHEIKARFISPDLPCDFCKCTSFNDAARCNAAKSS